MGLDTSWLSFFFKKKKALNRLTAGLWNIASNTSLPVQHANHSASVRRSAWTSRLALRGYGCTTVRYLGSSSGGGGVGLRLVFFFWNPLECALGCITLCVRLVTLSRQCMGDLKRTQSYAGDEGAAFMQENLLRLLRRPVSQSQSCVKESFNERGHRSCFFSGFFSYSNVVKKTTGVHARQINLKYI